MCCRRLSPEQSQQSAQALQSIAPDDAFVQDMIKHWWRATAPAISAHQEASGEGQGQLLASYDAAKAGQVQGPLASPAAGASQDAAAVSQPTHIHGDQEKGQGSQQGPSQCPQTVTSGENLEQATGLLQGRLQGSSKTESQDSVAGGRSSSRHALDSSRHGSDSSRPASDTNIPARAAMQHHAEQSSSGSQAQNTDQPNRSVQLAGGVTAEAVALSTIGSSIEVAATGVLLSWHLPVGRQPIMHVSAPPFADLILCTSYFSAATHFQ